MAVMLALWVGCAPEPPPGPWAGCPDLDWSVRLTSSVYENVKRVVSLPDGDVLIAGDYEGSPLIGTDGTRLRDGYGARDGFVARLSPRGEVRWHHSFGAWHADVVNGLTLRGDRLWVGGQASGDELWIDGEAAETLPAPNDGIDADAFALELDVEGRLLRHVRLFGDGSSEGVSATSDVAGNVYVSGSFRARALELGGWTHVNPPRGEGDTLGGQAFLASFDPQGRPRWLTTWGSDGDDRPFGVGWLGDHLVAGSSAPPGPFDVWVSGALAHQAEQPGMGLLAFDPATGRLDDWQPDVRSLYGTSGRSLEPGPDDGLILSGTVHTPGSWWDTSGEERSVDGIPGWAGTGSRGARVSVGSDGHVRHLWVDDPPLWGASGGSTAPFGVTGWARALHDATGAPVFEPPKLVVGHDAMAALYDASAALQCAWWMGGADGEAGEDAFDAAFDGEGGLWVVGGFDEDLQVKDPLGQVLLDLPDEGNGRDGYILRFAPPGPF